MTTGRINQVGIAEQVIKVLTCRHALLLLLLILLLLLLSRNNISLSPPNVVGLSRFSL